MAINGHFSMNVHGRWVKTRPIFEDAEKNWSRDDNAMVTVPHSYQNNHCNLTKLEIV